MQPVPTPELLEPQHVVDDVAGGSCTDPALRAAAYEQAYREVNAYAQQLWRALAAARSYLWRSLPSDPADPGPDGRLSAAPTGPDDGRGWDDWIGTYAGVVSTLWGPQGDSGFGAREARETADSRRGAPNVRVAARTAGSRRAGA